MWSPLNTSFTVLAKQNNKYNEQKVDLPEEMGSSLSVVVSSNALCSFSCVTGLSLPICFPADLVIRASCSWISFPARK